MLDMTKNKSLGVPFTLFSVKDKNSLENLAATATGKPSKPVQLPMVCLY